MNQNKPKRRWYRFSLRALFVIVAVTSVTAWWWTRQLNWIRERHKFLATLSVDWGGERLYFTLSETGLQSRPVQPPPPLVSRILGEPAYSMIGLPAKYGQDLIDRASYLFPESILKQEKVISKNGHEFSEFIDVSTFR
jgi:hypothetical protein